MCLPTQLLPELSIGFFVFSDILFSFFFDLNLLFCKLHKLIFDIYVNY